MSGPKPIPTSIKVKTGNPGHQKLNDLEPIPPSGELTCPQHLTAVARREWYRVRPMLEAMGTVKPVDRAILAAYCVAYARWVKAENKMRKLEAGKPDGMGELYTTKNGMVILSPLLSVSRGAVEQMLKCAAELGIGAATRSRVQVEKDKVEDTLGKLLDAGARRN